MKHFQTVLFDLDGTLIDHFDVIFRCYEFALGKLQCDIPSRELLRGTVGGSMEVTMTHFVDGQDHAEAVRLFREHFAEIYLEDITVHPGGEWILQGLRREGKKLAIFTNKQGESSRGIARHLELDRWLDGVFGAIDTPHHKPAAAFSRYALDQLGARPEEACLIGDSTFDIQAAHNGGFPCHCVTTGTHSREELAGAGADGIYPDLYELGRDLFRLPARRTSIETC